MNLSKYILNTRLYTYRLPQIPVLTGESSFGSGQWWTQRRTKCRDEVTIECSALTGASVPHTLLKTWDGGITEQREERLWEPESGRTFVKYHPRPHNSLWLPGPDLRKDMPANTLGCKGEGLMRTGSPQGTLSKQWWLKEGVSLSSVTDMSPKLQ